MGLYVGIMSGTSLDGIDVALVDFSNSEIKLVAARTFPFPVALENTLQHLISSPNCSLEQLGETDIQLGQQYAEAVQALLSQENISTDTVQAIGCHGQTIFHAPAHHYPFSMQIGNANVIVEKTGITTVNDFRQRDIVLGGQGAPLVPAFHKALFQLPTQNRVIVNIGGISNITILPADETQAITGFDTGPGNTLLDVWYQEHHQGKYDKNGEWARTGEINTKLLNLLLHDPYFTHPIPKSTGRELFNLGWLNTILQELVSPIGPECVQRTLVELTAITIANDIMSYAGNTHAVYVCGGGAHNALLMERLQVHLAEMTVSTTDILGLSPDWVEACAFAWLAKQTIHQQTGNLPSATGANHPTILGGLYLKNSNSF